MEQDGAIVPTLRSRDFRAWGVPRLRFPPSHDPNDEAQNPVSDPCPGEAKPFPPQGDGDGGQRAQLWPTVLSLPLWERAVWLVVFLLLAGAPGAGTGFRWASPKWAAKTAFWGTGAELDPWGHDYLQLELKPPGIRQGLEALTGEAWPAVGQVTSGSGQEWRFYVFGSNGLDDGGKRDDVKVWTAWGPSVEITYSPGPNGVDERGQGDDVLVHAPSLVDVSVSETWLMDLATLGQSPWPWVALALLLAWGVRGPFVRRPRSPRAPVEAARAMILAAGPLIPLAAAGAWFGERLAPRGLVFERLIPESTVMIPAAYAVYGSLAVVLFLVAFVWRLWRPLAETPDEAL
jgi:hypothetical protein